MILWRKLYIIHDRHSKSEHIWKYCIEIWWNGAVNRFKWPRQHRLYSRLMQWHTLCWAHRCSVLIYLNFIWYLLRMSYFPSENCHFVSRKYWERFSEYYFHFQSRENDDAAGAINAFSRAIIFLPSLFLLCFIGERVTTSFDELNESVYAMTWYILPIKLQRGFLVPMMAIVNKPIVLKGVSSLNCSHDTFKRVRFPIRFISNEMIIIRLNVYF